MTGAFGSSTLPSLSQGMRFVNSYLLYPSPAPRCRYLIMTSTFVDLLEMFFHALWQLAEVDFTRISWNRPIIFARYIWVYSDQQVLVSTAFYSRYDYQKWVNLHITSWSKMQESPDDIILTSAPVAHLSSHKKSSRRNCGLVNLVMRENQSYRELDIGI